MKQKKSNEPVVQGNRIKGLRQELRLSQSALGKLVKVSQPVVSDWESGNHEMKADNLVKLAKALKTTEAYLMGQSDLPAPSPDSNIAMDEAMGVHAWEEQSDVQEGDVMLPFYKDIEVAAGMGSETDEDWKGRKLAYAMSNLRKNNVPKGDAFFVMVRGDSLEPKIEDGSTVGINRAATKVRDGELYAIEQDGLCRLKVMYNMPGGKYRIHSYNTEEYPDEIVDKDSVRIIGQRFSVAKDYYTNNYDGICGSDAYFEGVLR